MKLTSKCAVVTGGAMGIGYATVKRLLEEGCSVTIWDLNPAFLQKALNDLSPYKGRIWGYECDVTDKVKVYQLAEQAIKDMGKTDILVNNAGYVMKGDFLSQNDEIWERTISVNFTSMIYTIRAFLPSMYERNSGHIINISSAAGTLGVPGLAVYAATKWAVWGLTESLRFEAWNNKKYGVKFSSVHPSYLASGMFEGASVKGIGSLIIPKVKSHDVIAKAVVNSAIKKRRHSPKRPVTVNLGIRLRGLLPDFIFQKLIAFLGITKSMSTFKGRENNE